MYVVYSIIFLALIAIVIITITLAGKQKPEFTTDRSENFNNVTHYEGKYNNEKIKVSPEFDWVEFKGEKYYKHNKDNYVYKGQNKTLYFKDHPYYYIERPILIENVKKEHNIPKIIWQTMKEEPIKDSLLYDAVQTFKNQQGWDYRFITDEKAKVFLKENFDEEVLHAFEVLIPGAYKADLLRACLLYIHGGVYADSKLFLHYDLDSFLDRDLVLVKEFNKKKAKDVGVWNGFLASIPKQEYFKLVIDSIVKNVKNLDYKNDELAVTGPLLYGKIFMKVHQIEKIENVITEKYRILNTYHVKNDNKNVINEYNNQELFITWDKKRSYLKNWATKDYSELWKKKNIFDKYLHKKYFK